MAEVSDLVCSGWVVSRRKCGGLYTRVCESEYRYKVPVGGLER